MSVIPLLSVLRLHLYLDSIYSGLPGFQLVIVNFGVAEGALPNQLISVFFQGCSSEKAS